MVAKRPRCQIQGPGLGVCWVWASFRIIQGPGLHVRVLTVRLLGALGRLSLQGTASVRGYDLCATRGFPLRRFALPDLSALFCPFERLALSDVCGAIRGCLCGRMLDGFPPL